MVTWECIEKKTRAEEGALRAVFILDLVGVFVFSFFLFLLTLLSLGGYMGEGGSNKVT